MAVLTLQAMQLFSVKQISLRRHASQSLPAIARGAILAGLCLLLYLPGISRLPPIDRDEARYAQATRQMLETGDLIRPRFQTTDRFKKPIGIYLLQAAAVSVAGQPARESIWAYRLPSVVGALAAVLLTWMFGRRWLGDDVAMLGAALLGCSGLMAIEAVMATTDATLLACVVIAQGCLGTMYLDAVRGRRAGVRYSAGLWLAIGAGILIKGPVIVGVIALTAMALAIADRSVPQRTRTWAGATRWRWGLPLAVAVVLPWTISIWRLTDGEFFRRALAEDILPRFVSGQNGHFAPAGYYTVIALGTFWPGSIISGAAIVRAIGRRMRPAERFLLAWLVPSWLVVEMIPTKLPHYVLPLYPALALITARAAFAALRSGWFRRLVAVEGVLWACFTVLVAAGILRVSQSLGVGPWAGVLPAAAALAAGFAGMRSLMRGYLPRALWLSAAGAVLMFATLRAVTIPRLDHLWLSREVSVAIASRREASRSRLPVAVVGYVEPSLVFLVGTDTKLTDAESAAALLEQRRDALVITSRDAAPAFTEAARRRGLAVTDVWSTEGLNYSKGQRMRLEMFAMVQPG